MNDAVIEPTAAVDYPPGDYCIVELFGHSTLVGRYSEVERFGTKMLALEPLFNGTMLPPVLHGGSAIYRLTPCSAEVAFERQPTHRYQLPPAIFATVPVHLLQAPEPRGAPAGNVDHRVEPEDDELL